MATLNLEKIQFTYKENETINGAAAVEFLKTLDFVYPNAR
jgi:hypothetical protein